MGNWICNPQDVGHLAAVARDFCPFPDYSPSPLLNMLSANSSVLLSEHYAAVQASLTPQQQQDFTQTLRSTFGREGKVSYGAVGVVALSLAVLFDTVSRQVKGEHVSDKEPIPGLFLRDPRGTYPPPVHTVSRYLRLVPHIANNPTRMRDETEKYLHELYHTGVVERDAIYAARQFEDITALNLMACVLMGKSFAYHLNRISNITIDLEDLTQKKSNHEDPKLIFNLNCDPEEASERFRTELDSFGDRTKEAFKNCELHRKDRAETVVNTISEHDYFITILSMISNYRDDFKAAQTDFDLKVKALGKWN